MKLNKVEPLVHSLKNYKMKLNKVEALVHSLHSLLVHKNYKMKLNKVASKTP